MGVGKGEKLGLPQSSPQARVVAASQGSFLASRLKLSGPGGLLGMDVSSATKSYTAPPREPRIILLRMPLFVSLPERSYPCLCYMWMGSHLTFPYTGANNSMGWGMDIREIRIAFFNTFIWNERDTRHFIFTTDLVGRERPWILLLFFENRCHLAIYMGLSKMQIKCPFILSDFLL